MADDAKIRRKTNVDACKVVQVIQVESIVGEGVESDPVRRIYEYFTLDGVLLARVDSTQERPA